MQLIIIYDLHEMAVFTTLEDQFVSISDLYNLLLPVFILWLRTPFKFVQSQIDLDNVRQMSAGISGMLYVHARKFEKLFKIEIQYTAEQNDENQTPTGSKNEG